MRSRSELPMASNDDQTYPDIRTPLSFIRPEANRVVINFKDKMNQHRKGARSEYKKMTVAHLWRGRAVGPDIKLPEIASARLS